MKLERLAEMDYEAAQSEKRDKLNGRLQVWSLLIALVGAFGLASVQSGSIAYIVGVLPLLVACLARYVRHSEAVLDQVKEYLFQKELELKYTGYECWRVKHKQAKSGEHLRAFRSCAVLIDVIATGSLAIRLAEHSIVLSVVVVFLEALVICLTCYWLSDTKRK
ncbi:hypothetical protein EI42_04823 [Thermosporothrix hazakensis]|uniref:Uncharacterized protein n=2 Tax=Thermosporothrix hazakensis TaxID=644383 RepID=A0A326U405_THEHA|nr:hypothetical protein EI42_04823 [Thermosporothrix hazakensis]